MKKSKKISVLISLVLITLLALGAVSAAEDTAVTDDASVAAIDEVQTVDDAPVTDEINYESNDIIVTDTGDSSDLDDADTDVISDTGLKGDSDDGEEAVVSDASSPKNALKAEPLGADGEPDLTFNQLFTTFNSGTTIDLQNDYKWTTGNNRYYTLNKNIVINGNGHIIDGAGAASLFRVNGAYTITLNNVTIKNCVAQANNNNYYGGVISAQNQAITVNINNANFINNTAGTANGRRGGVIYAGNGASIVVHNSTFINNTAYDGGIFYAGGSEDGNTPVNSYNSIYIGNNAVNRGAVLYLYSGRTGNVFYTYYYANSTFNYNAFVNNTAASGIIYTPSDQYLREFNFDYNWWGENHYNTSSVRVGNYLSLVEKYYVLKLKQTSATTIEVSLNSLFDGSEIPAGGVLPAREYLLTITGGGSEARITTPTGNFTGSASSNFTIAGEGTITAYVDNQVIPLDIYQNTRGTIELNVTIANVTLPNKAIAIVNASLDDVYNVTVGEKVYQVTVTGGTGQVELDELPEGTYLAMLSHVGNDEYHDAYNLTTFTVSKAQSTISLTANTTTPTYGTDVKVTATITPNDATGTIIYTVDGKNYAALEAGEDLIVTGLSAGEHRIVAKYGGNEQYEGSTSLELLINVQKATLTLSIVGAEVVYPETGKITLNSNVDGVYTIYVGEDDYEVRVSLGSGTVAIPTMDVGNYTVTVNVAESENYTAASATGTYKVTKADVKFVIDGDNRITYGETNEIIPTLTDGATGNIVYYVDGAATGTEIAYPNTFTTAVLDAGTHTIRAEYLGDENYKGKNATFTFTIAKADVDVTVTGATVVYPIHANVTVTASAAGTYIITVNGKDYTVEITEDGGSKLVNLDEIPVGVHYVAVTADETTNYKAISIDKAATVVVNKPQLNLTVSSEEITYGDTANVKITLKDGETGLSMTGLIVSVGSTYYPVNIVDGQGTLPVSGLNVGTYNVIAVCSYSENYDVAIANGTITVKQATPAATVTVTVNPITYGDDAVINIGLDGVISEKISGVVKVTVDSKEYDVVVTNGVGTLTVSGLATNAEGYTITATFAGNDNYGEATGTGSVVVNKADATVTVSADKETIKFGETATLSSVVTPSDDDGAVTYYVDGTAITGTTVSGLSVGEHTVVAKVAATANYNEATS
ncbi:beta strand repeat-containing protein, partial [Methanobrevibacter sp.]|uniref:beta strand repeat-containing protein n=1 Tax=Methanobrevibacter sp. TaxID=66852 RepID=UPI00388F9FA0